MIIGMGGTFERLLDSVRITHSLAGGSILTPLSGSLLLKRLKDAAVLSKKHKEIYEQMTATFHPSVVSKWVAMVEIWESSPTTSPNPYEEPQSCELLTYVICFEVAYLYIQQPHFRMFVSSWRKRRQHALQA